MGTFIRVDLKIDNTSNIILAANNLRGREGENTLVKKNSIAVQWATDLVSICLKSEIFIDSFCPQNFIKKKKKKLLFVNHYQIHRVGFGLESSCNQKALSLHQHHPYDCAFANKRTRRVKRVDASISANPSFSLFCYQILDFHSKAQISTHTIQYYIKKQSLFLLGQILYWYQSIQISLV